MLRDAEALEFLHGLNGAGNAKSCTNCKVFPFSILRCGGMFSEVFGVFHSINYVFYFQLNIRTMSSE